MGSIALLIGGCAFLLALLFVFVKSIPLPPDFSDGALADGGNQEKIGMLMNRAKALGLDIAEYETWSDLEEAITEEQ